ncbi:MAG: hypothetical protein L3J26_03555 [Candidatus Polarisedimenticolaceae bacterium]|nr:hypothetical protein [Candidatus Polarisedimenticolaceae bacterium]
MTALPFNRLLPAALIWVTAAFLLHELCSLDVWWHLVIGRDILQTLQVPELNIYSAGALNQPYHDSHWLFQVALAITHAVAGLNGPILFMMLLWGATLFIIYRETHLYSGTAAAVFITFLVMGASAERFLPRPEIITFLMIPLFYSLLRQARYQSPAQIALFVALQIIWVNSHGLFVIGPFMVGCYWLVHLIYAVRKQENHLRQLSILLLLIGLSLLASPYGSGALEYSFLLFSEVGKDAPEYMQAVNELSPTFGEAAMNASAFWFFAALMLLVLLSIALNPRQVSVPRLLIVGALCLAAFTGRRNIVLFALVAAPFVGEQLAGRLSQLALKPAMAQFLKGALLAALLAWSSYPLSGAYYLDMEIPARAGLGVTPNFFPHRLPDFIRQHNIQGQVYNTNRLGGFYLYHLYPERIPFMDGRWEIYGAPFFMAKQAALQSFPAWQRWVEKYKVQSALLHHSSPESRLLAPALYQHPDWSLVYYDFAASYFVKNSARGSAAPIIFNSDSALPAGENVRPDSRFILNAFYRNMGLKSQLLANLEQLLPTGLHQQKILFEMAKSSLELNRTEQAITYYLQLLEDDGSHTEALSDLSFIYYQKQQFSTSLKYSKQAVSSAPGNLDVRFNHSLVLVALDRKQDAVAELNKILAINPNYAKAKYLQQQIR